MGTLITTQSLQNLNACSSSYAFITGSLWTEGNPWYSGSNYEAYFEDGVVHSFTCSNSNEVAYLRWACQMFNLTGSIHNSKTGVSQTFKRSLSFNSVEELVEHTISSSL